MSLFSVDIRTDNDAFVSNRGAEIARILRTLADKVEESGVPPEGPDRWPLKDINGNTVGRALLIIGARELRRV